MTELFRGEEMTLCQIYFQAEAVYSCIAQLGELGIVQFRDVRKKFKLKTCVLTISFIKAESERKCISKKIC